MATVQIRSGQIQSGEVRRGNLNTADTGDAVVRKIVAGTNVTLGSTGVDAGTGDVTINVASGGDVVGPASATDNAVARFDGTTGKLLQNSSATIDDSGQLKITSILISS